MVACKTEESWIEKKKKKRQDDFYRCDHLKFYTIIFFKVPLNWKYTKQSHNESDFT